MLPNEPLLQEYARYPFEDVWPNDPQSLFNIAVRVPSELLDQFAQKLFELANQVPVLADMTFFCNVDTSLMMRHNVRDVEARNAGVQELFRGMKHDEMDQKEWQLIATLKITASHQALFWSRSQHEALVAFFTRWRHNHMSDAFKAARPEIRPHINLFHAADLVCNLTPSEGHESHHHHNRITSIRAKTLLDADLRRPQFRLDQVLPAGINGLIKDLTHAVEALNRLSQRARPAIGVQLTVHASIRDAHTLLSNVSLLTPFLLQVDAPNWW